jgi:hypothetical protein
MGSFICGKRKYIEESRSCSSSGHEGIWGTECIGPVICHIGSRLGGWSTPQPGWFNPPPRGGGGTTLPVVQEVGWVLEPVWTFLD